MNATSPPREERWDLSDLYADDGAFEGAKAEFLETVLPPVDAHRGRLLSAAGTLADALDAISRARLRLQRLHCYAALKSDEDTRVGTYQAMRQEVQLLARLQTMMIIAA